jgi:hypothetical protein
MSAVASTSVKSSRAVGKSPKPDVLYVNFKPDGVLTVSRERFETLTSHFGQDATFVTHFALSRLYADVQSGKLSSAKDVPVSIPEATGAMPATSKALLRKRSSQVSPGCSFKPTQTLVQAWNLKAARAR